MFSKLIKFRGVLLVVMLSASMLATAESTWQDWDVFAKRFITADGRVVDLTFDRKSTSEGQSYALFLALVANQRPQFDLLLKWTSDNLAHGQLGDKLPAWLWGLRDDGSWAVKDANSASDADLWIAYSLLEAARLWDAPAYAEIAHKLLKQIRVHEVVQAGRVGPVLLPGTYGFKLDKGRFWLNPSYLPGFMFRYFALVDPQGPWQSIWDGYLRMAPAIYRSGVAPDLFVVDSNGEVFADTQREPSGSYDAIRVYLWAGMSGPSNKVLVKYLAHYADIIHQSGLPPEKVNPVTAVPLKSNYSPIGYSAAVLPFLSALNDKPALEKQRDRVNTATQQAKNGAATNYYDQVLILFGKGWLDGQYQFDEQGRLQPQWLQ